MEPRRLSLREQMDICVETQLYAEKLIKERQIMEDPEITQDRYRRIQKEAIRHLEGLGIVDPRSKGGSPDYDAIRAYDIRLTDEVQKVLNFKM